MSNSFAVVLAISIVVIVTVMVDRIVMSDSPRRLRSRDFRDMSVEQRRQFAEDLGRWAQKRRQDEIDFWRDFFNRRGPGPRL